MTSSPRVERRRRAVAAGLFALLLAACSGDGPTLEPTESVDAATPTAPAEISPPVETPAATLEPTAVATAEPTLPPLPSFSSEVLEVEIVARHDHDVEAFTQGLEFDADRLFESRGRYGTSALTEIDPETGTPLRAVALDDEEFGEGLTIVDDRIIVLTYRENVAYVYDIDTFEVIETFSYQGEGWGICDDSERLVMSDGTTDLTFRDRDTFEVLERITVTFEGQPLDDVNELECVGDLLFANVFRTDIIVVIDPTTGQVVHRAEVPGLLDATEAGAADVLNGIAYDEQTGHFWITGKYWPAMFEIRFVES